MKQNLLYETKMGSVNNILKPCVKITSFSMAYFKLILL